jgi:3-mercaptopyruvate sulfurtransferase SseA
MKKAYIGNSEENHENLRALDGGCVRWQMKKVYIGNSEANHEHIRALEGGCVHWHMKKVSLENLRKITRISGP